MDYGFFSFTKIEAGLCDRDVCLRSAGCANGGADRSAGHDVSSCRTPRGVALIKIKEV